MAVTIKKIVVLPFSKREEAHFIMDAVLKRIKPISKRIDKYGNKYNHDTPWLYKYLCDPKFYLYRVKIGAIGRINTCKDAIELGCVRKVPVSTYHFTSMALYHVFRIARTMRREIDYVRKLELWIENLSKNEVPWNRFMEYYDL